MAKYYYNEALLPEIPSNVLAEFPYCFIVLKYETSAYQLLFSTTPWRFDDSQARVDNYTTEKSPLYTCVSGDEAWTDNGTGNYGQPIDGTREMVWSNHDICIGETSTIVYYAGTDAISEEEKNEEGTDPPDLTDPPEGGGETGGDTGGTGEGNEGDNEGTGFSLYKIEAETLTAIADEARRLDGGTTEGLYPSEMIEIFKAIEDGNEVAY